MLQLKIRISMLYLEKCMVHIVKNILMKCSEMVVLIILNLKSLMTIKRLMHKKMQKRMVESLILMAKQWLRLGLTKIVQVLCLLLIVTFAFGLVVSNVLILPIQLVINLISILITILVFLIDLMLAKL